jgi:hypothetical protein
VCKSSAIDGHGLDAEICGIFPLNFIYLWLKKGHNGTEGDLMRHFGSRRIYPLGNLGAMIRRNLKNKHPKITKNNSIGGVRRFAKET